MACLLVTPGSAEESREGGPKASISPPVTALAFSPDGGKVLVGSQAGIEVRTWPDLEVERRFETTLFHVHDLCFSPDGRWVAAAGGTPAEEGAVEMRSWPEGRKIYTHRSYDDLVYGIAWSPDAKRLACASYDRTVGIHNAASGESIRKLQGHSRAVLAVTYVGGGQTLVSAGVDLSLRVWNADTGNKRRVLDHHTAPVLDLAARPARDGNDLPMIASVSADRTLRLWQPTIGRLVRFVRFAARPMAVDWTANGAYAVVVCDDGHLRVVDPESVEVVEDIPAVKGWAYSVAASPRTDEIVVGGEHGQIERRKVSPAKGRSTR